MEHPAAAFQDALDDLIDARIDYRTSDSEWKTTTDIRRASEQVDAALKALILHTVREALTAATA
jgi:hypothetical protein